MNRRLKDLIEWIGSHSYQEIHPDPDKEHPDPKWVVPTVGLLEVLCEIWTLKSSELMETYNHSRRTAENRIVSQVINEITDEYRAAYPDLDDDQLSKMILEEYFAPNTEAPGVPRLQPVIDAIRQAPNN